MSEDAVARPRGEDVRFLERALRLARRGRYAVSPTPMVGCVLVSGTEIVGEGWHRRVGEAHAEVEALGAAGARARGATAYVTLEPCAHYGRTPPCCDALIAAGVARVVTCLADPDPRVDGAGHQRLRAAGITVSTGVLAERAAAVALHYLVNRRLARPAVTLKWAMSLDGKIATRSGESQWISSPRARRFALDLRERHDAIVVGSGTVLADDPRLTRRLGRAPEPIVRVALDRRLRTPPRARLFDEPGPVLVYTENRDQDAASALERRGAEVVRCDAVTPPAVLADLFARGISSVLVEGGGEVHAAFVEHGLYDRVVASVGPLLIGGVAAPGPLRGRGALRLAAAPRLERLSATRRGDDLVIEGLRQGCLRELSSARGG